LPVSSQSLNQISTIKSMGPEPKPFTTSSLKARIEAVFGPICGA